MTRNRLLAIYLYAKLVSLVVFTGLGGWVLYETAREVRYTRVRSAYTFDQVNKVLRESSQTMDEIRKGATKWQAASDEQVKQATASIKQLNSTFTQIQGAAQQLSRFITTTDDSLNKKLFPEVGAEIKQQSDTLTASQLELQKTFAASRQLLVDADTQVSNPAIKESLDSLAAASYNAAKATGDLAVGTKEFTATVKDVHAGIDYEIAQLEKPVKKVKAALEFVATIAGKFLGF